MLKKKKILRFKSLNILSFLLLIEIASSPQIRAQVTPDRSLGVESSIVVPGVIRNDAASEGIVGGARRGDNLFHSFQEFNIGEGRGVYFANPQGVMNIFSRVTGGNPSQILGRLGVLTESGALGGANLFFLNSNGILFGPNASLALGGSLIVSTARGIQFADSTFFGTDLPQSSPLLTVSTPIGLQFTQVNAKPIIVQGLEQPLTGLLQSLPRVLEGPNEILNVTEKIVGNLQSRPVGLQVFPGRSIALVGGDITLAGGSLTALGGRIDLGSVVGIGSVSLTPILGGWRLGYEGIESAAQGQIQLTQLALLNTSGRGGGEIRIQGRQVNLLNESAIFSATLENQDGGNIEIQAQEMSVIDGSIIGTGTLPSSIGNSGSVIIETEQLTVQGSSLIETTTIGQGKSGDLIIRARNNVNVIDDGFIATGSLGTTESKTGDAGSISIKTQALNIINGGEILNATSSGKGGNLIIDAMSLINVQGFDSAIYTDTFGRGNSGGINITTGDLTVRDGAQISAATLDEGKGGDIVIKARNGVELRGTSEDSRFPSGLFTSSGLAGFNFQPKGAGGNITLEAGSLTLVDRALISASSISPGNSGNITLKITSLFSATDSAVTATATQASGGSIDITAGDIRLRGNSDIRTNVSSGAGGGGDITLTADSILALDDSDILAFAQDGIGGNIILNTPIFFGNGYQTTTDNQAPDTLDDNGRVDIDASGAVSGVISVPDLTFIQNSLFELPETLINTENLIANSCVVPNQQQAGTFIITGSDGLPTRPNINITSPYPTGTIETIPPASNSPPPSKIEEPQGLYRLPDGRLVLSKKCI